MHDTGERPPASATASESHDRPLDRLMQTIGGRLAAEPGHVARWFERRVAANPDAILALEGDACWTYGRLDAQANRIARAGLASGLGPGSVVALLLPNGVTSLAIVLGLGKIGASFSLVNPALPAPALIFATQAIPPDLIVANEAAAAALAPSRGSLPKILRLADADSPHADGEADEPFERWIAGMSDEAPSSDRRAPVSADDTLFYIFTSGTTGLPKAARCSHRRYIASATSEAAILSMGPTDRMYVVLPMFHIAALSAIGAAVSANASFVLRSRFSASGFWDDVRRFGITTFQYLGEIVRYLVAQPPRPDDRDHSLRAMMGAGLQADVWRAFRDRFGVEEIVECYGSSEGVCNLINLQGVVGSVGREAPGENRLRIVRYDAASGQPERDEKGALMDCAPGEAGELLGVLASDVDFEGYSSEEATRTRIVEDPGHAHPRWFRTGDLFRRDEEGFYYFVDRVGDTFRWKGENVSTQEVAAALTGFPGIVQAVAYGVRVPGAEGRAGMAFIEHRMDSSLDPDALCRHLHARLPVHAVPMFVRVGRGASLTPTYKLRTVELQREGYDRSAIEGDLFVQDLAERRYVPLTPASLAMTGLPAFEREDA